MWKDFIDFCRSSVEVMKDLMDKYTVEIDEMITDFVDFWSMASCWFKEKLGLTVEDEEEMKGIGGDGFDGQERDDG